MKPQALAFNQRQEPRLSDIGYAVLAQPDSSEQLVYQDKGTTQMADPRSLVVRRLTPLECERLMGWEDSWTLYGLEEDGTPITMADTVRYKLCGNGVVANVTEWIGQRLALAYAQAEANKTLQ